MRRLLQSALALSTIIAFLPCSRGNGNAGAELKVEGKILSVSRLPAPTDIDYPDCNYSVTAELNTTLPQAAVIILPGIRASETVSPAGVSPGKLFSFLLVPEDDLTEDEKSIQISDDNTDFDLPYYYAKTIAPIKTFSSPASVTIAAPEAPQFNATPVVLSDHDRKIRDEYIGREKMRLKKVIAEYSEEDKDELLNRIGYLSETPAESYPFALLPMEDQSSKIFPLIPGLNGFQRLKKIFTPQDISSGTRAITHIHDYFYQRGILLVVIPVPENHESYFDLFVSEPKLSTYNINRVKLMESLLDAGVEVIDLAPLIESERKEPYYFHRILENNAHMTNYGNNRIAQYIAAHMNQYEYFKELSADDYSVRYKTSIHKTTYRGVDYQPYFDLSVDNAAESQDPIFKDSPYAVIGDSFTMGFLRTALADSFKSRINVISNTSAAPHMTRIIQTRKNSFSPKMKVCFFVFYSSYIYGPWRDFYSTASGEFLELDQALANITIRTENNDADIKTAETVKITQDEDIRNATCSFSLNAGELQAASQRYKINFHIRTSGNVLYSIRYKSQQQSGYDDKGVDVIDLELSKQELESHPVFELTARQRTGSKDPIGIEIIAIEIVAIEPIGQ